MIEGKQRGIVLPAALQLLSAMLFLAASTITLAEISLTALLTEAVFFFGFLGLGIVGLVLVYGLWTQKGWGWLSTLVVNLIAIVAVILVQPSSFVKWWYYISILGIPMGSIILLTISALVVIYLVLPANRAFWAPR